MKTEIIRCDRCKKEWTCNAMGLSNFKIELTLKQDFPDHVSYKRYDFCKDCEDEFFKVMNDLTTPK